MSGRWWRNLVWVALTVFCACRGQSSGADDPAAAGPAEAAGPADAAGEAGEPLSVEEGEAREPLEQFMTRFEVAAPELASPPGPERAGECPKSGERDRDLGIVVSPKRPAKDAPVRILVATLDSEEALAVRVEVEESGEKMTLEAEYRLGVPAATVASFIPSATGRHTVIVGREGEGLRCYHFSVREHSYHDESEVDLSKVWDNTRSWSAAEEALYSAWIRELFTGPADEDLAWKALSEVTSDAKRNFLHDHFGRGEDDPTKGMQLVPDCADTPYFLRAYWAYKRGLPFGFRKCSRGKRGPPNCFDLRTNLDPPDRRPNWIDPPSAAPEVEPDSPVDAPVDEAVPEPIVDPVIPTPTEKITYFFRRSIGWSVHTGNGRCAFGDSNSDLYSLDLNRRALRPGVVYADPYGHILVLAELVAPRGSSPGILFAIDGQPDGSITRKRFWEGNFLWNQSEPKLGGSGFKGFRPLLKVNESEGEGEDLYLQMNDETVAELRDYGDISDMQRDLSPTEFYDLMERLISPGTRSPFAVQAELVAALAEAVRVRVTSVNNGIGYVAEHPDEIIEMPWGYTVFETAGAWENYSTPARDLRLLIAMDVVLGFADKVRRNPEIFGLDPKSDPEHFELTMTYLDEQQAALLADAAHAITYTRSDSSSWTLGLDAVVARAEAFEAAYNPNDCPEKRWAAPEGSEELATCTRHAPEDQNIKMRYYRVWFAERRRPARGDDGPEIPELIREDED